MFKLLVQQIEATVLYGIELQYSSEWSMYVRMYVCMYVWSSHIAEYG